MRVWVTGRTREQVEAVASETGGRALVGDVSRREDVEAWFAEVGDALDLLVNNAGIAGPRALEWGTDPDEWWHVFEVNVRGPYLCCREAIRRMTARGGGRIVNVASGAAYLPATGISSTAYGPSRAALHRFSELLAVQLTPQNVSVFSISPGLVRTAMIAT